MNQNSGLPQENISSELQGCPEEHYRRLMLTQMYIYKNHINMHLSLYPHEAAKANSITHFFNRFGSIFRVIYCSFACTNRFDCQVRRDPCFKIDEVYHFSDLKNFPVDLDLGKDDTVCPHPHEQKALQIYIANQLCKSDQYKKYYSLCHYNPQSDTQSQKNKHIQVFLKAYRPILREMFCSTVCPASGICKNVKEASA